ncbi:hypothetical protein CQP30_08940 [Yersinia pestis]|uniref:Uncharacterized protein n=3 Tax=Yersinia pestis TaxID=632 RepID=A0A5P8YHG9_YERPE|nr:hypothetical [Yersinia pestis KIM10+]ADV97995.1 hypothetical protein YPC_1360 [Yersinia pestis biovar Medievalis str. Harbin 35]ANW14981.1 hypothetical protein BAY22_13860 [Yersinia pestis]AXY33775.1 hypothetical protein CEQ20_10320 [Yersinia pseudotuberculosis]EDM41606.1 hypothetical protein YPE_0256 [Yersinia pestis CA88-4125]EEO77818.1 hypothetical protein YP516_1505 [Yersinia pestis Nepal516]EEO79652.1 hypothetical protein YPF_3641 [Yersinia pestis biovar Orientalis str. India 195]EEO
MTFLPGFPGFFIDLIPYTSTIDLHETGQLCNDAPQIYHPVCHFISLEVSA